MTRRVRLVGGVADGDMWPVDEDLRPGDLFGVYVAEAFAGVEVFSKSAEPTTSTQNVHRYKLCEIRDRSCRWLYAVPSHHNPDDGLTTLFGRPEVTSGSFGRFGDGRAPAQPPAKVRTGLNPYVRVLGAREVDME